MTAGSSSSLGRWPANVTHDGSDEVMEAFAAFGERGDTGTAARFFYCAKASRADRGEGNTHPTVKSTKLMEWLVKLICPADGLVLDPFAGSGSTGVACLQTSRRFVGVEQSPEYCAIARGRLEKAAADAPDSLFAGVSA